MGDLFPATTTGADGRFTFRGMGRERIAGIRIEGPGIRATIERVVTRRDPTMRTPDFSPGNVFFPMTYYGARFDHVAEPSRPVVGVVRDKDTGTPLAGARAEHSLALLRKSLRPDDNRRRRPLSPERFDESLGTQQARR